MMIKTKTTRSEPVAGIGAEALPCVLRGTLVATRRGEVAVEDLVADDEVVCRDGGLRPVRWVGAVRLDARATPAATPVRIPQGALGRNVPIRDLYLAPGARIWMKGAEFHGDFGTREVLVPVRHLVGWQGIARAAYVPVPEYFLVLFDGPQIVVMDGLQVEMHHPGQELAGFRPVLRQPMMDVVPGLADLAGQGAPSRKRLEGDDAARAVTLRKQA